MPNPPSPKATEDKLEIGNIETGNTGNIGNNPHWVDVEAEGVTPVSGAELTNETFAGG